LLSHATAPLGHPVNSHITSNALVTASIAEPNNSIISVQSEHSVEVAQSVSEVLALRSEWEPLPVDPNGDLDFYLTVIRSHREIVRPHVVVVRKGQAAKSIVLGRIEEKPLTIPLGYKKVATRPVRFLMLIHGGVLGEDSEENALQIVASIQSTLRSGEADIAWFYGLDPNSALYRTARASGSLLTRDFFPTKLRRWRGHLPSSYEELTRQLSPNTRHNLKRYSKKLEQAFPGQIEVRSFRSFSDLETVLADTEEIASKTYHRGLGVGFINNGETRDLAALAAKQGWLRAHILYIAGRPAAFWNGFLYRRTFYTWTTGFAPEIADYRPGTFLLQKMFQQLCAEKAADEVDFGFGDAQYKRDWCDHEEVQAAFLLFAPRMKSIALNCFRSPLIGASSLARNLLQRTGALQSLKKRWRERLAKRKER
jgi:hypothetical protein